MPNPVMPNGFVPTVAAYSHDGPGGVIRTDVAGGAPRYALDYDRGLQKFNVTLIMDKLQFEVWTLFFTHIIKKGAYTFDMPLDSGFGTQQHACNIMPGSYSATRTAGIAMVVSFVVEAESKAYDYSTGDAVGVIDIYNAYGAGGSALLARLAQFALYDTLALVFPAPIYSGPSLDLDFANQLYRTGDWLPEYAFSDLITFTRSTIGTRTGPTGLIETVAIDAPRIDYDPVTLAAKGLLIEEQRTRKNTIAALPTAPEVVTVTAAAHSISFYGTGQVVLTGVASQTIVGTGAYPARKIITFTPTAGALTITPSGSVIDLQLEAGAFATSVIRGEGVATTRAADNASMAGANFTSWWNALEGSFVASTTLPFVTATQTIFAAKDAGTSNYVALRSSNGALTAVAASSGVTQASITKPVTFASGVTTISTFGYKADDYGATASGATVSVDTSATVPVTDQLSIGSFAAGVNYLNGHISRITYSPRKLDSATLQALTS